jgi:hypothetical protein
MRVKSTASYRSIWKGITLKFLILSLYYSNKGLVILLGQGYQQYPNLRTTKSVTLRAVGDAL